MSQPDTPPAAPGASRGLKRDVSASLILAGFIAVAISYAGPLLVVLEAARAARLPAELTASWVWAISVGSGVVCFVLSWLTRTPVMVAWSIPGAALLVTSLGDYTFGEAVGAYIACAVASALLGVTGVMGRLLALIPRPITAGVLAGVLLPFALKVAAAVAQTPIVAGGLVLGYLIGRRWQPRYAVFVALAVGGLLAGLTGQTAALSVRWAVTMPTFTAPVFTLDSLLGIALPLAIVTAAGQNAPGLIVLHNAGYPANDRLLLGVSGLASALFAPFGSHALNMAAVTSALAVSPEAHPDRARRYVAGMACGLFYIAGGFAGGTIVSLFSAIPPGMLTALAGVALLAPLQGSIYDTMHEGIHHRSVTEAALLALAVTASGVNILGVVSAFWGLVIGVVAYAILRPRPRPRAQAPD